MRTLSAVPRKVGCCWAATTPAATHAVSTPEVRIRIIRTHSKAAGRHRTSSHIMNGAMFERYTEPARRSLFFSRYEASVLGSEAIQTEHLLLGLLKERDPLVAHLLGTVHVTQDALRQLIYARVGATASPIETSVEIPFSEDTKEVLKCTAEEASRLLHGHVGPEHLLLGLLSVERGLAWDLLREHGLGLTSIREALVTHVSANSPPPPDIAGLLAGLIPG